MVKKVEKKIEPAKKPEPVQLELSKKDRPASELFIKSDPSKPSFVDTIHKPVLEPIKPLPVPKEIILPPKPKKIEDYCKIGGSVQHQNHSPAFKCSDAEFMEKVSGRHAENCAHVGYWSATKCGCNK